MELNSIEARRSIHALDTAKEALALAQAEVKHHSDALAAMVNSESGTHTVHFATGSRAFTVSENNTYDTALMLAALKPGQIQRVTERKVSNARVKALYPDVYAGAKSPNGVKVTLR